MATSKRCKTCEHWGDEYRENWGDSHVDICALINSQGTAGLARLHVDTEDDVMNVVVRLGTDAEFGCVHWEKIEKPKRKRK